jgi:aldose 1-epimerase
MEILRMSAGEASVEVAPALGGRLAQLTVAGRALLVAGDATSNPMTWGMYPMAPWPGRLDAGRFELDGRVIQVPINLDPFAIHGLTFDRPWQVEASTERSATLSCPLDWELGGLATQQLSLTAHALDCQLTVRASHTALLAEVGWHPWFVRADRIGFQPQTMFEKGHDGLPTGNLIDPTPGPWDDCFLHASPVELHYSELVLTISSDTDHLVVYDEPRHANCIEPQSGPPNAFNLSPRRIEAHRALTRSLRIAWSRA